MAKPNGKTVHKKFYEFAYKFLVAHAEANGIPENVVQSYLVPQNPEENARTLNDVFQRLLFNAQHCQRRQTIGINLDGVENLAGILHGFDVHFVLEQYEDNEAELLEDIIREFNLQNINTSPNGIWYKYCRTITSVANFLAQFETGQDFLNHAYELYNNETTRDNLPREIHRRIYGFGPTLASDFLKDFGFVDYARPYFHLREILEAYDFINTDATDEEMITTFESIAADAGVLAYALDKVLWLISSGDFYWHTEYGNNGRIRKQKDEFMAHRDNFYKQINSHK